MTRFEATNRSREVVAAERERIWQVLTDPQLLAELAPLVADISAQGDRWCWQLAGISAMGVSVAPSFTERMDFTPQERIEFTHAPPPDGPPERAGADGVYELADAEGGTLLSIELTIHVDLPLPRMARGGVERVMAASMERTGDAFARNLLDHLGVTSRA